jgi:hypothetical protein
MVEPRKELNSDLTPEQQDVLIDIDMQILLAKNFLTKCGYVTLTKQSYINLNRRVIVGVLAGVSPGLLLGYALCRWMGG